MGFLTSRRKERGTPVRRPSPMLFPSFRRKPESIWSPLEDLPGALALKADDAADV